MKRWSATFLMILILGGAWVWLSRPPLPAQAGGRAAEPAVGRQAPDFSLVTLTGERFVLSEQRGKPVVLNFWATWCQPCQRELPALQNAAAHYGSRLVVAGVDQGETVQTVQRYVNKLGLTFVIPMDGRGEVGERYHVRGLPTTFFIDDQGVIQSIWMGEMNSVTLAENIARILY